MKEIDKYMTVAEASERWGIPLNTVKAKLKNREKSYIETVNQMIEQGLIKYYTREGGTRRDWIISEMAMEIWFGEKKLKNQSKGEMKTMIIKTRNRYYNPNPLKKETCDCVIRAMCKATGKDWDTTFKNLVEIAFELKTMPNADSTWKEYIQRHSFVYNKFKRGTNRPTVQEFATKHKKGTYVLSVANHIVTCEDGYYYDTWDCGEKTLYGYWSKETNEKI